MTHGKMPHAEGETWGTRGLCVYSGPARKIPSPS